MSVEESYICIMKEEIISGPQIYYGLMSKKDVFKKV
jgi:hypothetical protein